MKTFVLFLTIASASADEIRQFDIPTLERLGNELAHRDEIAARASDAVLDSQPAASALKLRGWISDLSKAGDKVYLITDSPSGPVLAYTVAFKGDKPAVEDRRGEPLPASVALRYKALSTVLAILPEKLYTEVNYNYEVLSDPDGSGFLVYALAATGKKDKSVTGGHFRVTVSSDASKAERIDSLGQLNLQSVPADAKAIVSTQMSIPSNFPVETWIYTSRLYRVPMFVGTRDHGVWEIVNGTMHKFTDAQLAAMTKTEKKKKK